jgi:hypothetical protein
MSINVVSLGSWCRPAWQIRKYFKKEHADFFDWNITSFKALQTVLSADYTAQDILVFENCVGNLFGSVTDLSSGLIFQHDLPLSRVGGLQLGNRAACIFLSDDENARREVGEARMKAQALFQRTRQTCRESPTLFVRWLRNGHPDGEWPSAFEGEAPHKLLSILQDFCGHSAAKLLYVVSETTETTSGCQLQPTRYGGNAIIQEAEIKYVDGGWAGDADAWSDLFQQASSEILNF